MKIFYTAFKMLPTNKNPEYHSIGQTIAYCWIKAFNTELAIQNLKFHITKNDDWIIKSIVDEPIEVTRENFVGKDIGLSNYDKAENDGIALIYSAISKDKKTTRGPFEFESEFKWDLEEYLQEVRKNRENGRCLHPESGSICNEYIKAHSIQKSGLLKSIAQNGQVYGLSSDMATLDKNHGRVNYVKQGVKKVSIFRGFCKKHDKELFRDIDDFQLMPTDKQIFLYAYRSIAREIFAKTNSLNTYNAQLKKSELPDNIKNIFEALAKGTEKGLSDLMIHKNVYDKVLLNESYNTMQYVIFLTESPPVAAFSGLLYPDFDFLGRQLQDLSDVKVEKKLITFCSAPLDKGWAYIFAWHESSSIICDAYMRSLATRIYDKYRASDILFRLMLCCENHVISPDWWEKIEVDNQVKVLDFVQKNMELFYYNPVSSLMGGLEGIANWEFERVLSNMSNTVEDK